jgi:hypothetical protein
MTSRADSTMQRILFCLAGALQISHKSKSEILPHFLHLHMSFANFASANEIRFALSELSCAKWSANLKADFLPIPGNEESALTDSSNILDEKFMEQK